MKGKVFLTVIFGAFLACQPLPSSIKMDTIIDAQKQFEVSVPSGWYVEPDNPYDGLSILIIRRDSLSEPLETIDYIIAWERHERELSEGFINNWKDILAKKDYEIVHVKLDSVEQDVVFSSTVLENDTASGMQFRIRQRIVNTKDKEGSVVFTVVNPIGHYSNRDSLITAKIFGSLKRK
jgi:hypothetical protein